MNTQKINNIEYVLADDIIKIAPIYSNKCRNGRELIKKHNIIDSIYLKLINDKWVLSDGSSKKFDKIFIKKSITETIPEFKSETKIIDENNIELAPEIIYLEEHEKFKDNEGNIIEIETIGTRKLDGIFFKIKDVMKGFEIPNLNKNILDKKTSFINEEHYKYFNCKKVRKEYNKTIIKKQVYLTYEGMLKVLFTSHSPKTKKFIKWATETLFTLHMGTKTQKEELISTTLGVTAKVIREVFNADCHTIPCVYLMTLNTVKELKKSMKIDEKYKDDSIVAKYGFTKDLSRRTGEHIKTYEKIEGCNLKLKHYSYVDPQYISNAETSIKTFMNCFNVKLEYLNEDELVIIPKEMMELVKDKYETIGKKYAGHISELITKLKDMENNYEKMELRYKMENEKLTYENNILKVMNKNEILEKDLEIMKLKYELIKK